MNYRAAIAFIFVQNAVKASSVESTRSLYTRCPETSTCMTERNCGCAPACLDAYCDNCEQGCYYFNEYENNCDNGGCGCSPDCIRGGAGDCTQGCSTEGAWTAAPTEAPTPAPTTVPSTVPTTGGVYGDPHIKTWTGEQFDFHGICDLVLISNPEFRNGAGLDVHIRNKKMRQWSYVDTAAIRIGEDILEVRGGEKKNFWINGIESNGNTDRLSISDCPIHYYPISEKSEKFVVDLGDGENIVFKTWDSFVSVSIENPKQDKFVGSVGLMGSFPEGAKLGRKKSIIEDINVFGQEWQVISSEQNLFHEIEGPQYPQHCEIPSSKDMRRRLAASLVTVKDAERACAGAGLEDKELCIFDVLATNDQSSAGAY